ncbi:MAG: hypothetical protein KF754_06490 [Planctomycetes bacterium]|nr:hypothetical protein [Planctomycetota bacterium]
MQPDEYNPLPPEAHAFLDGTLSAEQEAEFRRRMDRDQRLASDVEGVRAALGLLKTLPVRDPGPGFAARVLDRVRDEEMGERARRRIRSARTPVWQHVAQVAAGAVAAAIVLALVAPGLRNDPGTATQGDAALVELAGTTADEDDLLPGLGEHFDRYRQLAIHMDALADMEGETQRLLIRSELELSGLQRRNVWLASQLAGLPVARQREYRRFLEGLDNAVEIIEREVTDSAAARRPVNIDLVRGTLAAVKAPDALVLRRAGAAGDRATPIAVASSSPEVAAYQAIRVAVYRNDHERALAACRAYLAPYSAGGKFVRPATIIAVACLLRLDRELEAAAEYERVFGLYEEKLTGADQRMLEGVMTAQERRQLQQARLELHGG